MKSVKLLVDAVINLRDCKAGDVVSMKSEHAQKWVDCGKAIFVDVVPFIEPVKE